MSGLWAIAHATAVVGPRLVEDATVIVRDGVIEEVGAGLAHPPITVDARGALLLPGLVDSHSDGLEKEIRPRPTARFDLAFALRAFEARLRGVGITTVFHGIGYQEKAAYDRTIAQAVELRDAIDERRLQDAPVDHRVLYRLEARTEGDLPAFLADLGSRDHRDAPPMVSFEDHSPGQGQYRDVEQYRRALERHDLPNGMTIDDYVAHRIAEAERLVPLREEKLEVIGGLAASGRIRLLAHDCEDDADVAVAAGWPASIAEFPLTVSAARAARDRGMAVVMGAPNVIRGGSHSGNVAAAELVSLGLCTALASDYQPATMLASAFKLAADRVCDLPTAVALVSAGPAAMSGLHDRGVIEPGRRADLVLAAEHGRWPHVVASWRSEGPVGRPALAVTPHADWVEVS